METWKKALVMGSFGIGAVLLFKRHPAGIALGAVGLAALASEYPEEFETISRRGPEYFYRGTQIVSRLMEMAERLSAAATEG